jgi:hypothetical protein
MKDLVDGFFPFELKGRFPDGIPLAVTDRHTDMFKTRMGTDAPAFLGHGHVLGGGSAPTSVLLAAAAPESFAATQATAVPGGTQGLLNRLPTNVVRNGCLVDIRASIAESLAPAPAVQRKNVQLVPSAAVQEITNLLQQQPQQQDVMHDAGWRPQTPADIATLRVGG